MKVKERKVNAKFIEEKLIPFILREQGRGFLMSQWVEYVGKHGKYFHDDLEKEIRSPACGTAACIGGSVQILCHKSRAWGVTNIAKLLGLTEDQAQGLFFCWPEKFAIQYREANTPYRQARVAVALLREVIKTNGECLCKS